MASDSGQAIGLAPFQLGGALKGFVVSGRWPDSTKEWAQLLIVTVRIASVPGLLSTTTVFGVREELPERPAPGTVGLVVAEGTVVGDEAVEPGRFAGHQPPALLVLH
ncbi:MAG: peptidase, partial [Gordonia amarae]